MDHHDLQEVYQKITHSEAEGVLVRRKIWIVFWVLLAVTICEVFLTFTGLPAGVIKFMLITMTLVKAFSIVAWYMHLIDEVRNLILVILVPFGIFVLYLLWISITEANFINGFPGAPG
ncbi:MAG: cytochrome C oxidase subunit IV family protein [Bacteroidetes bacterium]|nr:cytochrome C oxidase subunit IV family protein [Bacteroidota bacterium]